MKSEHGAKRFPWVLLIVLLAAAAWVAALNHSMQTDPHRKGSPLYAIRREHARRATCMSNVKQLMTAIRMYSQDHDGRLPSYQWSTELNSYLAKYPGVYMCPNDASAGNFISYGYSGLLLRADGSGISSAEILAPKEVGVICDASPSTTSGGIVGGGGLRDMATWSVIPSPRHISSTIPRYRNDTTVVGYADGHVQFAENDNDLHDLSNELNRAFSLAGAYGLVDNPIGGISSYRSAFPTTMIPERVTIDGEPCTRPLLRAAAALWHAKANAPISQGAFRGQDAVVPHGGCYLLGTGDGVKPAGKAVAIACDGVVLITAKDTRIPKSLFTGIENGSNVLDCAGVRKLFGAGSEQNAFQTYTFATVSGTRRFFSAHFPEQGKPLQFGANAKTVKDDEEMVRKVAADPYGIGYCSAAFADLQRVDILALHWTDGKTYFYPNQNPQLRWTIPNPLSSSSWPLLRTLYAEYGGRASTADGAGIVNVLLDPRGAGTSWLQSGPLFQASYGVPGGK